MKIVIEKLGITPGPWIIDDSDINYINDPKWFYRICQISEHRKFPNNTQLISAAPELLDAMIDVAMIAQNKIDRDPEWKKHEPYQQFLRYVHIIEKATDKTWEEIKELFNE